MPIIYFVRHGESEANIANSVNDDPTRSVKLTVHGRLQCTTCADQLRAVALTHAYASEFPRAQESLQIILRFHPELSPRIDPRLNEWRTGLDGQSIDYFHEQMNLGFHPAEPFDDVVKRMTHFVDDMRILGGDTRILVVSHKITIVAGLVACGSILPDEARHMSVHNGEIIPITL